MSKLDISFDDFYSSAINDRMLEECLDLHYKLNPQFTKWYEFEKPVLQQAMKSHDIAHIIFGCNTRLLGEMRVELWTLFGTNIPFKVYYKYVSNSEVIKLPLLILKQIGIFKSIWFFVRNIYEFFRILRLSTTMKKKWPTLHEESYMSKTVGEIREEFGVPLIGRK